MIYLSTTWTHPQQYKTQQYSFMVSHLICIFICLVCCMLRIHIVVVSMQFINSWCITTTFFVTHRSDFVISHYKHPPRITQTLSLIGLDQPFILVTRVACSSKISRSVTMTSSTLLTYPPIRRLLRSFSLFLFSALLINTVCVLVTLNRDLTLLHKKLSLISFLTSLKIDSLSPNAHGLRSFLIWLH